MLLNETPEGIVLADKSLKPLPGDIDAFQLGKYPQLGKMFSTGIITHDVETIDGAGLEGVVVLGKVTATIVAVYEPYRP